MVTGKGTKPYVTLVGNSAEDVTGSMYNVRYQKYSILLDCGLIQGADALTNYQNNRAQLKRIKAKEIDYIILSHLHADHSGLIPALYAMGCHAHLYVPKGSIPFLRLLWEDTLKIMQSDEQKLEHKYGKKCPPLFQQDDIEETINRIFEDVEYDVWFNVIDNIRFKYLPAGHIIHSAQIVLELGTGSEVKRIGYTGDIGGNTERHYTEKRVNLPFVDLLIGEHTYNSKARINNKNDRRNDIYKIKSIISEYNKILIPTFSLQRTQELLDILVDIHPNCPIYLDSPLAIKFCKLWDSEWDNVKMIEDSEGSRLLQMSNEHCIILSASGFLQGGRIISHLKTALPNVNNHIIFVGYAGENNLASQIKENQSIVTIDGEQIENKANITELRSFSSHASREELIEYYSSLSYNKLILVHGDKQNSNDFISSLKEILIKNAKSSKVVRGQLEQKIYF